MSDMPEADWPGEWPLRVYILHPDVKNFGDMVTAPERREYISADKVAALVEALKLYSCGDGCNDCPQSERDRVSCGWTASATLAAFKEDDND